MCDYSLGGLLNRLAVDGEELTVHRFSTHSIGLASSADLEMMKIREARQRDQSPLATDQQFIRSGVRLPLGTSGLRSSGRSLGVEEYPDGSQMQMERRRGRKRILHANQRRREYLSRCTSLPYWTPGSAAGPA